MLYYLGTCGYSKPWANPDNQLHFVRSFASSLRQGRPSEILGLQSGDTYCETVDSPFSFLGFQLMNGRRLIPNCYTLKSATVGAIMTSWKLEASNDLCKWVTLD